MERKHFKIDGKTLKRYRYSIEEEKKNLKKYFLIESTLENCIVTVFDRNHFREHYSIIIWMHCVISIVPLWSLGLLY